jgi:hypothetical protein
MIYWQKLGQKTVSLNEYDIKVRWAPTEEEDLWCLRCLTLNKFGFIIVALMYPISITVLYEEEKCYELMDKH